MSLRNYRKIYGNNTVPPPEDTSDEEYEPLYAKASQNFSYNALLLSSHSENEEVEPNNQDEEEEPKKSKKKKKKRKHKAAQKKSREPSVACAEHNTRELDEIDRSVMEVNALLGKSPTPPPPPKEIPEDPAKKILAVQHKHLNCANERFFGSKPLKTDENSKRHLNNMYPLHLRKNVIVPLEKYQMVLQKNGLSMSVLRREDGSTYFVYDHNKEYQSNHAAYLQLFKDNRHIDALLPFNTQMFEKAQSTMHIEALLECADKLFNLEEYTAANTLIEQMLIYMLYAAHPSFNLADMRTRLEYKYLENRAFHIIVLKYLHLLTNRACHRTALELAKLLLNLDPSDPLAVVFIIDTLALRAREHMWLIEAVDNWKVESGVGFLFNMQFSYAMAKFHVAKKNQAETTEADVLLQTAMRRFPFLAKGILKSLNLGQKSHLRDHELFQSIADRWTTNSLKGVLKLYVKFSFSKWREPMVAEWVIRNTEDLINKYNSDNSFKEETKKMVNEQYSLFRSLPREMNRHLCIIKPMDTLIVDGEIPEVPRYRSCDPAPPPFCINRYGYDMSLWSYPVVSSSFFGLFSSLLPQYQIPEAHEGAPGEPPPQPLEPQQEDPLELLRMMHGRVLEHRAAANNAARPPDAPQPPPDPARDVTDVLEQALNLSDSESGVDESEQRQSSSQ